MLHEAAGCGLMLFCYEGDGTLPLGRIIATKRINPGAIPDIAVIIGPEGGFSKAEAQAARAAGATMTGLGKRILRTETAAAFVLGCLSYEFELKGPGLSPCE
jgi:16S rRNA (uracil1498-N3)-methyltransferase